MAPQDEYRKGLLAMQVRRRALHVHPRVSSDQCAAPLLANLSTAGLDQLI